MPSLIARAGSVAAIAAFLAGCNDLGGLLTDTGRPVRTDSRPATPPPHTQALPNDSTVTPSASPSTAPRPRPSAKATTAPPPADVAAPGAADEGDAEPTDDSQEVAQ
jgi:hypothetical protein